MGFVGLNHPVRIRVTLIFHSVVIALITGLTGGSFWFSYVLVLVFLGGVLVLFLYITRLAANEKFIFKWSNIVFMVLRGALVGVLLLITLPSTVSNSLGDFTYNINITPVDVPILVIKLYRSFTYVVTLGLISYLLYVLLVCVAIVGGHAGALRNFN
jgi:NADH-ubiquinone oxidoreductase chain 6